MKVPLSEAKGQLLDLARRAEAGEEVILTRRGNAVVRLVPVQQAPSAEAKRAVMEEIFNAARRRAAKGPSAAKSQDFLYNDRGLPS